MFNTVAVVGATGAVGQIILQLLQDRKFPAKNFRFLASARSAGQKVEFNGTQITVEELTHDCFKGIDLLIASTPDETAAEFLPSALKAGCKVIDESGFWRMNPDVALVVPEINPEAALNAKGIIASPNCSTTQMVVALKPLHDAAGVLQELTACRAAFPRNYIRLMAFDSTRNVETIAMSFIVNRPAVEPGFTLARQEVNGRSQRYTIRGYASASPEGERYR